MGRLVREVIASYEARVSSVEQIIEATHEMLEAFRSQREAMRIRLRETLARAASLRRRDFDAMIQGLLDSQEARERTVKETMRDYLAEQKALAATLRETLAGADRIEAVKELLGKMGARRAEREREVKGLLAEYRREQEEMVRALEGLLSNGGSVKVREFRAALRAIQSRCWSRSVLGAGMLLALLALWAGQGVGGETAIWREVAVHGQDLAGQLAQPVSGGSGAVASSTKFGSGLGQGSSCSTFRGSGCGSTRTVFPCRGRSRRSLGMWRPGGARTTSSSWSWFKEARGSWGQSYLSC